MTDPIREALERLVAADSCVNRAGPEYAQAREAARAALDATPPTPAAGEVGKLVAWLHGQDGGIGRRAIHARIATLLEQFSAAQAQAPQPVPVSERLPGPRDCAPWPDESDASAWCWVGSDVDGGWSWEQRSAGCLAAFPDDFTHWLPAHALPLPSVEVQP